MKRSKSALGARLAMSLSSSHPIVIPLHDSARSATADTVIARDIERRRLAFISCRQLIRVPRPSSGKRDRVRGPPLGARGRAACLRLFVPPT